MSALLQTCGVFVDGKSVTSVKRGSVLEIKGQFVGLMTRHYVRVFLDGVEQESDYTEESGLFTTGVVVDVEKPGNVKLCVELTENTERAEHIVWETVIKVTK